MKIKLSVVIPAYSEASNLELILPAVKKVLAEMVVAHEIIVVDTQSPMDQTESVCAANGVVYLNRRCGDNYGDAIRTAINHSKSEWIVFMDGDGSHAPEYIASMYKMVGQYDLIAASRYIDGGITNDSRLSVLLSYVLNTTYRIMLGIKIKDISNSFKMYKLDSLKKLKLKCNHFDIIEEMVFGVICAGDIRIFEFPIIFQKRINGMTKREILKFIYSYLKTLINLFGNRLLNTK